VLTKSQAARCRHQKEPHPGSRAIVSRPLSYSASAYGHGANDNAVLGIHIPCFNHENVGLMMWAKAQD